MVSRRSRSLRAHCVAAACLPGVFEIAIVSKAALAVLGLTLLASADHGSEYLAFDGMLTLVLLAAYFLADGWTAWRMAR